MVSSAIVTRRSKTSMKSSARKVDTTTRGSNPITMEPRKVTPDSAAAASSSRYRQRSTTSGTRKSIPRSIVSTQIATNSSIRSSLERSTRGASPSTSVRYSEYAASNNIQRSKVATAKSVEAEFQQLEISKSKAKATRALVGLQNIGNTWYVQAILLLRGIGIDEVIVL